MPYPQSCFYVNCSNSKETHMMFRFPVYDKERLQTWIKNSGNSYLSHLSAESWRYRYLCSSHFDKSKYVIHGGHIWARILPPAVPKHYNGEEETIDMVNEAHSSDSKLLLCKDGTIRETAVKSHYNCEDEAMDDNTGTKQSSRAVTVLKPRLKDKSYIANKKRKLGNNCKDVERIKTRKLVKSSRKTIQNKKLWLSETPSLTKEDCGTVSVKEEHAEECSASGEEQYEEISGASVKQEPEDYGANLEQEQEDYGANMKQEPENNGANVKQEDSGSAAYIYEEHEFPLDIDPEQLQPQDIALTLSAKRTKDGASVKRETARVGCVPTEAEKSRVETTRVAVDQSHCSNPNYRNRSASM